MGSFSFKVIWSCCMIVVFLGMFYMLAFTHLFDGQMLLIRIVMGIVFLLYAFFRMWQLNILLKNHKK
jgi:hypothetical protein